MKTTQFYVMNHKTRDASSVVRWLTEQNAPPVVSTDLTDYYARRDEFRLKGLYDNFRRIMGLIRDAQHNWGIILHDDVSVAPGVVERVLTVLDAAPAFVECVAFFNPNNGSFRDAWEMDRHVVKTAANFWTLSIAFRKGFVSPVLEWGDKHVTPNGIPEDHYLKRCFTRTGRVCYVIVPSFFQHVGYDKSTLGNAPAPFGVKRTSATYDAKFYADTIDWPLEFGNPYLDGTKDSSRHGLINLED